MNRKKELAFGIEPSTVKYRLRLARYPALAQSVRDYMAERRSEQKLKLLDVGVGRGRAFRYLGAHGIADRIEWYGIDRSKTPVTSYTGAGKWQIEIADVEQGLPYGGETFDIVIAEQILEHLRNPAFALSEMLRVARKDALIVIGVPIMPRCGVYLRKLFKNPDSEHVQSFTLKNLKSLLFSGGSLVELSTRGFRVISGGPLRWLENYEWWYRLNAKMGEIFPGLCIEVQIAAKKI